MSAVCGWLPGWLLCVTGCSAWLVSWLAAVRIWLAGWLAAVRVWLVGWLLFVAGCFA
jgi:hypothetical protein